MRNFLGPRLLAFLAALSLFGCECGSEGALKVVVTVDPSLSASCLRLEVQSNGITRLQQELTRSTGKDEYTLGLKQADLPKDVQLVASTFFDKAGGCPETKVLTSASRPVDATFPQAGVTTKAIEVRAPGMDLDFDRDLHVDFDKGGDDCNDKVAAIHPGATVDCTGNVDNDCDGLAGCADSECSAAPNCNLVPTSLVYVTTAAPLAALDCSPPLTVELRDMNGAALAARSNAMVALAATGGVGVTFYSDAACTNAVTAVALPAGSSRATFRFSAATSTTFNAIASTLGLPPASQAQTVTPALVSQLAFSTPARMVKAGDCTAVVSVETRDKSGAAAGVLTAQQVALTADRAGVAFFTNSNCTNPLAGNTLAFAQGVSSNSFYLKATTALPTQLTATLSGLPPVSQALTVTPGNPSRLVFATGAQGIQTSSCSSKVTLEVRDATDNVSPVTAATMVTLTPTGVPISLFTTPGCTMALSGPQTIATGGSSIDFYFSGTAPGMVTITATASGLSQAQQQENIGVGPPAKLAFISPVQSVQAGQCSPQPARVQTQDSANNASNVAGMALPVTFASSATGFTLYSDSNCTMSLSGAVTIMIGGTTADVWFRGTTSGSKQIDATAPMLTGTNQTETITPAPPTVLVFTSAMQTQVAGTCAQFDVESRDSLGNASGLTAAANLNLSATPGGLLFYAGATCANPSVTFVPMAMGATTKTFYARSNVPNNYSVTAQVAGPGSANQAFNVTVGPPAKLGFVVEPTNVAAGAAITPSVQVAVQDALGNTVTSSTANVTLSIANNPPGTGMLAGTLTVAAVNGIATFPGISVNRTGNGYTLGAASGALTAATSAAFNVTPGAPAQLAFGVQPSNAVAGASIVPAVTVRVQDALGNTVTSSTASVTVAIGTNPSSGTLSGTATVAAVAGVATFPGLSINRTGMGYTLAASSGTLTAATSTAFDIATGPANRVAFTVQPSSATAGAGIAPSVAVAIQDAQGNTVTTANSNVTVAIGTNPGGGTLSGTATVAAVAGVATFPGLSINRSGTGYTLGATSSGLTAATSAAFDINAGAASQLVFTVQPGNTGGGVAFAPALQVAIQDALGNVVTSSTANVTLAIGTNPGTGVLSGTATVAAVAGVATFPGLSIDKVGTGYTLTATSGALPAANSAAFNIVPGPAAVVVFTVQPTNATAGAAIAPSIETTIRDAVGNTVTTSTANVTLNIGNNPGGGTLSGTTTVAAVAGVATFPGISINRSGTGYTLTATAGTPMGTSASFDINAGPATKVGFTVQPPNAVAGVSLAPAVQVAIQDALGNTVTSSTANIGITFGTNPGGGTLSGTTTVAAVAGVATFSNLSIDKAALNYTLFASSGVLTSATSFTFNISAAGAAQVGFTVQPSNTVAGASITPAVKAAIQDAFGNTVTSSTANITVAISTNPGGGTLSGTATVAAVAGVATFSNLSINKAGTAYTLGASSGALTGGTSLAFDIAAGPAAAVAFTVQPTNTTAGSTVTPAVAVAIQDAFGNTLTSSTANVTVAIGTNPGGGTLSGTATVAAVAGVATFNNLSINKSGTGYTLGASSGALTSATSNTFDVIAGTATKLLFTVQPTNSSSNTVIAPSPQVGVFDALDNVVTTSTASVTIAIGTNPSGGTLSGTLTVAAVSGLATFSNLQINNPGSGYTLAATSAPLTASPASNPFNVVGPPTKLVLTTSASPAEAGACATVRVTRQDAASQPAAPNSMTSVTLAAAPGTGFGFYSDSACTVSVSATGITNNTAFTDFYVKGITGGTPSGALTQVLTASSAAPPLTSGTLNFDVLPMVRRGTCTIANGLSTNAQCSLSPAIPGNDISRTFLVFSVSGAQTTASDANVACHLFSNVSSVDLVCERSGTSNAVTVTYQTVSSPKTFGAGGFSVQRFNGTFTTSTALPIVTNLGTSVDLTKSFTLFSTFSSSNNNRSGHFLTSTLTSGTVSINETSATSNAAFAGGYAVEVVSFASSNVLRGNATALTNTSGINVPGLTSADTTRTFVLHSARTDTANDDDRICKRKYRGVVTSATALDFTRADSATGQCIDAAIPDLSWERVELPATALVQPVLVVHANDAATGTNTFSTAIDLTRSFYFMAGQGPGGQGGGESNYSANDTLGAVLGVPTVAATTVTVTRPVTNLSTARFTVFVVQLTP